MQTLKYYNRNEFRLNVAKIYDTTLIKTFLIEVKNTENFLVVEPTDKWNNTIYLSLSVNCSHKKMFYTTVTVLPNVQHEHIDYAYSLATIEIFKRN